MCNPSLRVLVVGTFLVSEPCFMGKQHQFVKGQKGLEAISWVKVKKNVETGSFNIVDKLKLKMLKKHLISLGMPSFQKSAVFLNIVQKAFDPPPFI